MAAPLAPKQKPREEIGPDEVLCDYCTAKCCRYFALPIEKPTRMKDFQFIRWYLLHGQSSVFTEDGTWYLLVHADCKHLGDDNRCQIYDTRPQICRDYTTQECEYEDDWTYEKYFETPEQIEEYAEAILPPRDQENIRSRMPNPLPVLAS
ncbi:MAG: YkgJ family cysteine cluster protein [Planctomycetaceae bacterium]|nr:YkgJ family cysteine cluster protein [Planctomycetaceae bacterium]